MNRRPANNLTSVLYSSHFLRHHEVEPPTQKSIKMIFYSTRSSLLNKELQKMIAIGSHFEFRKLDLCEVSDLLPRFTKNKSKKHQQKCISMAIAIRKSRAYSWNPEENKNFLRKISLKLKSSGLTLTKLTRFVRHFDLSKTHHHMFKFTNDK